MTKANSQKDNSLIPKLKVNEDGYIQGVTIKFERVWKGLYLKQPSFLLFHPKNSYQAYIATNGVPYILCIKIAKEM